MVSVVNTDVDGSLTTIETGRNWFCAVAGTLITVLMN